MGWRGGDRGEQGVQEEEEENQIEHGAMGVGGNDVCGWTGSIQTLSSLGSLMFSWHHFSRVRPLAHLALSTELHQRALGC